MGFRTFTKQFRALGSWIFVRDQGVRFGALGLKVLGGFFDLGWGGPERESRIGAEGRAGSGLEMSRDFDRGLR